MVEDTKETFKLVRGTQTDYTMPKKMKKNNLQAIKYNIKTQYWDSLTTPKLADISGAPYSQKINTLCLANDTQWVDNAYTTWIKGSIIDSLCIENPYIKWDHEAWQLYT